MFTRLSSSLSRIFRLRNRRGARETAGRKHVARPSESSLPTTRRAVSAHLQPIVITPTPSTARPRSLFIRSVLSPIVQSPIITSPRAPSPTPSPTPVLIIGRDPVESILPSPAEPALLNDVEPQSNPDGISSPDPSPLLIQPGTRRVSFQLPPVQPEDPPESPLSTCSTLVSDVEVQVLPETGPPVSLEQHIVPETYDSASSRTSTELDAGLDNRRNSGSGRRRPFSLFSSQPVRVNVTRFSLPATPTAPMTADGRNVGNGGRADERISPTPSVPGSRPHKKESRFARWSRELYQPETQEVLRVIRWI